MINPPNKKSFLSCLTVGPIQLLISFYQRAPRLTGLFLPDTIDSLGVLSSDNPVTRQWDISLPERCRSRHLHYKTIIIFLKPRKIRYLHSFQKWANYSVASFLYFQFSLFLFITNIICQGLCGWEFNFQQKICSGQSYKLFTVVIYNPRVVIWGIFKSGTSLESQFTSINCL